MESRNEQKQKMYFLFPDFIASDDNIPRNTLTNTEKIKVIEY